MLLLIRTLAPKKVRDLYSQGVQRLVNYVIDRIYVQVGCTNLSQICRVTVYGHVVVIDPLSHTSYDRQYMPSEDDLIVRTLWSS